MMDELFFQKARKEDCNRLNCLIKNSKGYWGYSPSFLDQFMHMFSLTEGYLDGHMVMLMHCGDQVAGFFSFNDSSIPNELDYFFIAPAFIGKGLGKKLWEACLQEARRCEVPYFTLCSDPHAEPFYFKMGCERIGVRRSPLMPGRTIPVLKFHCF